MGTRRTVTPIGIEGNAKTTPSIREDRCVTTSLAPNTPPRRERSRRRAPQSDVDSSEHRCKIEAGDPNRKPRREDGSAPSTKRDPPHTWDNDTGSETARDYREPENLVTQEVQGSRPREHQPHEVLRTPSVIHSPKTPKRGQSAVQPGGDLAKTRRSMGSKRRPGSETGKRSVSATHSPT